MDSISRNEMLRTGMKNKTDKQMSSRKHRTPKSQTEIDNGAHPLHWATSLGPSPMGTDPINGFKNCTKWFWNQLQQL